VGRNAVKLEECSLIFSSSYLRMLPRYYSSLEPAFRTWLHESIADVYMDAASQPVALSDRPGS